ncbi:MAG: hypothetical protein ACI8PT_000508 [Gammaproteobacteria bacterium]|jgi:hypothetical protein
MFGFVSALSRRRVLFVSGSGATLYRFTSNDVEDPMPFSADDRGVAAFTEHVQFSPSDPIFVLVDIVEEDFRLETVPHVFGRDRSAVLENKRSRLFRESRYVQSVMQGRETEGRRDDKVLFTSIIRPEIIDAWLTPLNRLKIPVAGIYSLPVLSRELTKLVSPTTGNVLYVSLQSRGGLRQTFFDQSHLKVSRLATMPRLEPNRIASYVLQEVERVRRYLNSLRLLNRDVPLNVCMLVHGSVLEDLKKQAQNTVTAQFTFVEIATLETQLKAHGLTSGDLPYADRLFAYLLAKNAPANFYATHKETRHYSLQRVGRSMTTLAALSLLGGIGWSGFEFAKAIDKQLEVGTLAKQAGFYEERYKKGKERLPKLPSDGMQIRRAVEMVHTVGKFRETPLDVLVVLSQGLDVFPEMRVSGIEWGSGANPNATNARATRDRANSRGGGRAGRERQPATDMPDYFQFAKVSGYIEPFDGNYRLAIERVNRFAQELRSVDGVEAVSVVKRPLEVSSRERLTGTASSTSTVGEAEFELKIVLRTHGEPS